MGETLNSVVVDFTNILIRGRKDNTYKFALARFLLDYINSVTVFEDKKISYEDIAAAFLRYYWNQIVVYKLDQDFKTTKKAKITGLIKQSTNGISEHYVPFFKNGKNVDLKNKLISDIYKYCLADVIPRFQIDKNQNIYVHNAVEAKPNRYYLPKKEERFITLKKEIIVEIKTSYVLLFETLILEWAKFLEKTNFTPRLIQKVEKISDPRRGSLNKFKKVLLESTNSCFYCEKPLLSNNIHVDHFIPWSYVFEDESWNLVLSCRKCNLSKSNRLPSKSYLVKLEKLKGKNQKIIDLYDNCEKAGFSILS